MTARLGVSPLLWSNDDLPELGAAIPLEVCLAEAHAAGYEGIELGHKFPRDPQRLRAVLERHGLALISGWYGARLLERSVEHEIEAMQPHLTLLLALGCQVIVLAEMSRSTITTKNVPLSARPRLDTAAWNRFAGALTELAEHLSEQGIRLAYHHHMGTVVQTEADVDRLLACTGDAVGLLLDTGHLAFAGGDPAAVARRHGQRIMHVHVKDIRSDPLAAIHDRDGSFLDAIRDGVFTVPGDGSIDFQSVLAALAEHGYSSWLVVEADQDPARAHPLTYARMGHRHVQTAGRTTGLIAG